MKDVQVKKLEKCIKYLKLQFFQLSSRIRKNIRISVCNPVYGSMDLWICIYLDGMQNFSSVRKTRNIVKNAPSAISLITRNICELLGNAEYDLKNLHTK